MQAKGLPFYWLCKKNLENNDVIQAISSKTANDEVSIEG
jgi:hypothetical protein